MPMSMDEQEPSLVADIYKAALDPSAWGAVLAEIAKSIGGTSAGLWVRNRDHAMRGDYYFGGERDCEVPMLARRSRLAPSSAGPQARGAEDRDAGIGDQPSGAFLEIDLFDAAAQAGEPDECGASLIVSRSEGAWDEAGRRRMRSIVPHLRRAMLIGRQIARKRASAAVLADTLDHLGAHVFIVGANGETLHVNAQGRAALSEGDVLRSARGRLTAAEPRSAAALDRALCQGRAAEFVLAGARRRHSPLAGQQLARLFPAPCRPGGVGTGEWAAAAGLITDEACLPVEETVSAIARHFRLTPREHEVLLAIVQGETLKELSARLSVSPNTLKTHMRRLFKKTGAARQIEFVKLCGAFRNPFAV